MRYRAARMPASRVWSICPVSQEDAFGLNVVFGEIVNEVGGGVHARVDNGGMFAVNQYITIGFIGAGGKT